MLLSTGKRIVSESGESRIGVHVHSNADRRRTVTSDTIAGVTCDALARERSYRVLADGGRVARSGQAFVDVDARRARVTAAVAGVAVALEAAQGVLAFGVSSTVEFGYEALVDVCKRISFDAKKTAARFNDPTDAAENARRIAVVSLRASALVRSVCIDAFGRVAARALDQLVRALVVV